MIVLSSAYLRFVLMLRFHGIAFCETCGVRQLNSPTLNWLPVPTNLPFAFEHNGMDFLSFTISLERRCSTPYDGI